MQAVSQSVTVSLLTGNGTKDCKRKQILLSHSVHILFYLHHKTQDQVTDKDPFLYRTYLPIKINENIVDAYGNKKQTRSKRTIGKPESS